MKLWAPCRGRGIVESDVAELWHGVRSSRASMRYSLLERQHGTTRTCRLLLAQKWQLGVHCGPWAKLSVSSSAPEARQQLLTVEKLGTWAGERGEIPTAHVFTSTWPERCSANLLACVRFVSSLALPRSTYSLHLSIPMGRMALDILIKTVENRYRMFNVVVIEQINCI
jgi:hypothetical protein